MNIATVSIFFLTALNNNSVCSLGEVRLVGGNTSSEGRVEICIDNNWGTVCDDRWQDVDAGVVCKQLNFSTIGRFRYFIRVLMLQVHLFTGGRSFSSSYFGDGSGPIHMDNVFCTTNENRLLDCLFDPHTSDCNHQKDAGVRCYVPGDLAALISHD